MQFEGKVAIVTGGASGIGAATARRLASEGAAVLVADVDEERGEGVARALVEENRQAAFERCDVSKLESWTALVQTAVSRFGRLDIVHNNAYILEVAPTHETTEEQWHRQLDVTLAPVFLSVRAAIGELQKRGGAIVNTSSVLGVMGMPGHAAYAAAKGGMCALTRELAAEYAPDVRVNAVIPGGIATPAWGERHDDVRDWGMQTPAGRLGRPEEVAAVVAFLASDDASYITGECVVVDGGWTITKGESGFGFDPAERAAR